MDVSSNGVRIINTGGSSLYLDEQPLASSMMIVGRRVAPPRSIQRISPADVSGGPHIGSNMPHIFSLTTTLLSVSCRYDDALVGNVAGNAADLARRMGAAPTARSVGVFRDNLVDILGAMYGNAGMDDTPREAVAK